MYVTCYGAAREVTGSFHLITTQTDRIALDCGMFQGRRREAEEKNRVMPVDPSIITNVVLSHAHIDHSGRIPLLVSSGFLGRIVTTDATADASKYLLLDSARIQEGDADYLNYKTVRGYLNRLKSFEDENRMTPREIKDVKKQLKRNSVHINSDFIKELIAAHNLKKVEPLYTTADAEQALAHFEGYPYDHPITVGEGITCRFYDAGHILGSAISVIKVKEKGRTFTICYSGDFGRFDKPILKDPTLSFAEEDRDIDLMIVESTYGDREHEQAEDSRRKVIETITTTIERGGSVLIPAFAFGRAQELIYRLHGLYDEGVVPKVPVYIDSPLASNLTKVFGEHPEIYDKETHRQFLENGKNPFSFKQLNFVKSVEESMALMRSDKPSIIIASSGMCEGGRILHHLRYKIHDEKNTIMVVGFMARHTLGRRLLDAGEAYAASNRAGKAPVLKFFNKEYPLRAHVVKLGGFSAHGDRHELMRLINGSNLKIKKVAVVHGEEDQAMSFAARLSDEGLNVVVPHRGEAVYLD